MAFWVVKAKRSRTDLSEAVRPGKVQRWRTRKPPRAWKPTDGVLLWQSSPDLEVRGIGTIVDIPDPEDGEALLDIRYDAGPYTGTATIGALRQDRRLEGVSFLKAGAAGTMFPIDEAQARAATEHLVRGGADGDLIESWLGQTLAAEHPTMAISIRQPYTELILRGIKTIEFRSRPAKRRGRVFIYAAMKPGPDEVWEEHGLEKGSLLTGSVVGTVDIMSCVRLADGFGYRLAHPERAKPRRPQRHPQPTWFRPFG